MNKFKIILKKETIYIAEGGSVIGDICFCIGNWYFPEENWDDFVVSLIYWLSYVIVELNFNKKKKVQMRFMEGDFKIYLTLGKNYQCTIEFIEGDTCEDQKEIIHKTITIPFEDVKNEVKKACELLLQMKKSKELDFEEDYEDLKDSYELLCKI